MGCHLECINGWMGDVCHGERGDLFRAVKFSKKCFSSGFPLQSPQEMELREYYA